MKKTFVLDTNVLLHDPGAMTSFEEHRVVIPIYVIEEIDNFKKDLSELGRNARHVSRKLDQLRMEGDLAQGVETSSGGCVQVKLTARELPTEFRSSHSIDNSIMATALECHELDASIQTIFVTKDVNLRIRAHALGLVYYRVPQKINHFAGVPVLEGNHLRGVLIADRTSDEPFVDEDISVMTTLAGEIIRAVQVERIFSEMDTERYQRESFYEASRSFNQALSVSDVSKVAVETVSRLVQLDFASVAVAVPDVENTLTIEAVHWSKQSDRLHLLGERFDADDTLIGAAIRARHPLPHGTLRSHTQAIFGTERDIPFEYIKVLPLLWKKIGVGALVLASREEKFLSHDMTDMLKVVADHAAIAIANAQMYERMERMATTDGLTNPTINWLGMLRPRM